MPHAVKIQQYLFRGPGVDAKGAAERAAAAGELADDHRRLFVVLLAHDESDACGQALCQHPCVTYSFPHTRIPHANTNIT